ncbi:MAG: hypothetical protein N2053_05180 [Chitinispirillaceae bacterium]|nr:hypothetical protein [Chitinispirillaceae bacterium]
MGNKVKNTYFYAPRKPTMNLPVIEKDPEEEWAIATDIQEEIRIKKGKFVSLSKIGRVAKEKGLRKDTGCGFYLYHRNLINYF